MVNDFEDFSEVRFVVKSGDVARVKIVFNFVMSNDLSGNKTLKTRKCTVSECMVSQTVFNLLHSRDRNALIHRN